MTSYRERQNALFQQLKNAEKQYTCSIKRPVEPELSNYGTIDKRRYRKIKHEMNKYRGKESIFKRANASIGQCLPVKNTPDYIKHPEKWQYYTLSDVTDDHMSDRTNIETALSFIQEMEKKAGNSEPELITDETGAVFKKPTFSISKTIKQPQQEKPDKIFKSNKIIMPEYVVGLSKRVNKDNPNQCKISAKSNTDAKKAELKLNHLYYDVYDDDDEEDEVKLRLN